MADTAQLHPAAIDTALPSGSEVCTACGAPLEAHDKFCVACGAANDRVEVLPTKDVDLKKHFRCQTCGAEVSADANQRSFTCPFCDSNYVVEYAPSETGRQAPEFVIPFAVTPAQAEEKFRVWLRTNSWFRPGDLVMAKVVEKRLEREHRRVLVSHRDVYRNGERQIADADATGARDGVVEPRRATPPVLQRLLSLRQPRPRPELRGQDQAVSPRRA
jgi:predicted RNA-binding Zn-ribbon protein involved in translation (DUF1610 family)